MGAKGRTKQLIPSTAASPQPLPHLRPCPPRAPWKRAFAARLLQPIKIISVNSHGLSRNIPEPVKRSVRQRCGFGCILCGSAVVQYHHFAPPLADAKDPLASGITVLCGRCHQKADQAGEAEIASRNAAPFCKVNGYTQDFLFISKDEVRFQTGSPLFKKKMVVMYDEEMLIGFAPPEQAGGPLRLFARVTDDEGNDILQIVDNEWRACRSEE